MGPFGTLCHRSRVSRSSRCRLRSSLHGCAAMDPTLTPEGLSRSLLWELSACLDERDLSPAGSGVRKWLVDQRRSVAVFDIEVVEAGRRQLRSAARVPTVNPALSLLRPRLAPTDSGLCVRDEPALDEGGAQRAVRPAEHFAHRALTELWAHAAARVDDCVLRHHTGTRPVPSPGPAPRALAVYLRGPSGQ